MARITLDRHWNLVRRGTSAILLGLSLSVVAGFGAGCRPDPSAKSEGAAAAPAGANGQDGTARKDGDASKTVADAESPEDASGALPLDKALAAAPAVITHYRRDPIPSDALEDVTLEWDSALGPGGAFLPRLQDPPQPSPESESDEGIEPAPFSRLAGVHFPADSQEIVFFGEHDPAYPPLATSDLLDAFVLACRAQAEGVAPGMSIDPKPDQLARGLNDGDLMDVVYFGGTDGTDFGAAAFECDRLMKCLSFGVDNVTKKPLTCAVPGYRDELDLLLDQQGRRAQSWHRFWIEHSASRIEHSGDGRTFLLDVALAINTQYMVVQGGQLAPGKEEADPAARAFSQHMTDHYFEYAKQYPVFARLHAYAALTSLARAFVGAPAVAAAADVATDTSPAATPATDANDSERTPPAARPELDWQWILDEHDVRAVEKAATTPAIVVSREKLQDDKSTLTRIQLTGGVTLQPQNRYRAEPVVAAIGGAISAARRGAANPRRFEVSVGGKVYQAAALRPARSRRFWQEDLRSGSLAVVRDYSASSETGDIGRNWTLRRPRLEVSAKVVAYEQAGKMPQSIAVRDGLGAARVLDKFGLIGEAGQKPTSAYSTADGRQRLLMYANTWLYLDGDVQFFMTGDGGRKVEFGPQARLVHFSPEDGHAVREVRSANDEVHYAYENGRLTTLSNAAGDRLRFAYDAQGRVRRVESAKGGAIEYRFDGSDKLKHVVNERDQSLAYSYDPAAGLPTALRGDLVRTTVNSLPPVAQLSLQPVASASSSAAAQRRSDRAAVISIAPVRGEASEYRFLADGRPLPLPDNFQALVELACQERDARACDQLRQLFLTDEVLTNRRVLVLEGEFDLAQKLAQALRDDRSPVQIFAAADASRAIRHLSSPALTRTAPQILHFEPGLQETVREQLQRVPTGSNDGNTLIITGHHSAKFAEYLRELGERNALRGKNVVLVTCGRTSKGETLAGLTDQLLNDQGAGAVSFVGFHDVINQQTMPHVVARLREALTAAPAEGAAGDRGQESLERILRGVLEQLREEAEQGVVPGNFQPDDLKAMQELLYEKVGRIERRRPVTARAGGDDASHGSGAWIGTGGCLDWRQNSPRRRPTVFVS